VAGHGAGPGRPDECLPPGPRLRAVRRDALWCVAAARAPAATEDALSIIDQHSTNGTWVNGQRLTPGQGFPLTDGDVIELGGLRMILRIDDAPGKAPEAPSEPQRKMKGFGFRFLGRS